MAADVVIEVKMHENDANLLFCPSDEYASEHENIDDKLSVCAEVVVNVEKEENGSISQMQLGTGSCNMTPKFVEECNERTRVAIQDSDPPHHQEQSTISVEAEMDEHEAETIQIEAKASLVMERNPDRSNPLEENTVLGVTSFHIAAELGEVESLTALLTQVPQLDVATSDGFTALHVATSMGQSKAVSILLAAGADPSHPAVGGATPLHSAARSGHTEIATMLLDAGAECVSDHLGFSPLHDAAHAGHHNLVCLLLARKALPSVASQAGTTPLDLAAQGGHCDVVEELLPSTVDETLRALQLAASGAHRRVLKRLLGQLKRLTEGVRVSTPRPDRHGGPE